MNKMRPRKTRDQWAALIDQQQQSELSILEFCQTHDVGFASFGKWKRRLNPTDTQVSDSGAKPAFTPVNVNSSSITPPAVQSSATVTLNIGSDMILTIVNSGS